MRILVGDDQPDVLDAARLLLKSDGHVAVTATTPEGILRHARSQPFDVVLVDMNYARDTTSGGEGLNLLESLRASGVVAPVVVMTAWGSIDLAVEAMRRGASDFVQKPWDNTRLLEVIRQQAENARRQRTDLEIARAVQQRLQGRVTTPVLHLDYSGSCLPVGDIGGDYFDFVQMGGAALGVVLADVSGKGISAALLMAHLQAAVRSRSDLLLRPESLVTSINQLFWESSPSEQFATLFYGIYRAETRTLEYVNAAHGEPVLLTANGPVKLASTGVPVGMFPAWRGESQQVTLSPGDRLAIVSDGVLEAGLSEGREFGHEGVVHCLQRNRNATAELIVSRLLEAAATCGPADDMTAVVLNAL
jgi:sigma-B regulation protein RsbU (phosphoserine phosphatase)